MVNHPAHVKRGVVCSLVRRAEDVSMNDESLKKEMGHLRKVLTANGYPSNLVRPSQPCTEDEQRKDDDEDKPIAKPSSRTQKALAKRSDEF